MSKFSDIQFNFLAGELSPRLRNRLDIDEYKQGVSSLINFIPQPSGGISYRSGFGFVKTVVSTGNDRSTGIEYHQSSTVSYKVVFDPDHATPASRISLVRNDGTVVALTGTFGSPYTQIVLAHSALPEDFYGWRYAQRGALLFITHTNGLMKPLILFRAAGLFYLADYDAAINLIPGSIVSSTAALGAYLKVPYTPENGSITMTLSVATVGAGRTLTSSIGYFTAAHVGSKFRSRVGNSGAVEGLATITAFTDSQNVTVEIHLAFSATTATANWRISEWSDARGWPKFVTIYAGRVVFLSTTENPDQIWASTNGNFFIIMDGKLIQDVTADISTLNYYGALDATDAFSFFPNANNSPFIKWVSSGRSLTVGTDSEELSIDELDATQPANLKAQTNVGSSDCNVVRVFNSTFYVAKGGKKIQEFSYSEENGSYISKELTILNNDILDQGLDDSDGQGDYSLKILQLSWNSTQKIVWAVVGSSYGSTISKLVGFSYDKSSNLKGWFRIENDAQIFDVANIKDTTGNVTETWVTTKRTINGSGVFSLEKLSIIPNGTYLIDGSTLSGDKPLFLDYYRVQTIASSVTFNGFTHLAGEEVDVIADHVHIGKLTVSGAGVITLATAARRVIAGFLYRGFMKTLNIEAGGRIGNAQILFKKIDRIMLPLYRSSGGQYGFSTDNMNDIEYPDYSGYYTGDSKPLDFDSNAGEEQHIIIVKEDPTQFNLLGILMRGQTEG